jgi:hypothetical protein
MSGYKIFIYYYYLFIEDPESALDDLREDLLKEAHESGRNAALEELRSLCVFIY